MEEEKYFHGKPYSKLDLADVMCSICLNLLIEPVTMPCNHELCLSCFKQNVENSSLTCPLCRKRISVWCRKATKSKSLVNEPLWNFIQKTFPVQVSAFRENQDGDSDVEEFFPTVTNHQFSLPGEIGDEYRKEMKRTLEEEMARRREEEEATSSYLAKEEEKLSSSQNELMSKKSGDKESKIKRQSSIDIYLGQFTPRFNVKIKSVLNWKARNKENDNEVKSSVLHSYNDKTNPISSHRQSLKDISSGALSRENSSSSSSFHDEDIFTDELNSITENASSTKNYPKNPSVQNKNKKIPAKTGECSTSLTIDFNDSSFIAEQKLLEKKILQEKADEELALRLQREFNLETSSPNRRKGSKDEYFFRQDTSKRKKSLQLKLEDCVPKKKRKLN